MNESMSISLVAVRHVAQEVVVREHEDLTVLGVTAAEGHRNQAEILMARVEGRDEPALFVVRVRRDRSEFELRQDVRRLLREHVNGTLKG